MCPAARRKVFGVALLLVLATAIGAPAVYAGKDPACVQACQEQYTADKNVCKAAYMEREVVIQEQRACCIDPSCLPNHPEYPQDMMACLQDANRKHMQNVQQKNACFQQAQSVAWNCYRACPEQSEIQP